MVIIQSHNCSAFKIGRSLALSRPERPPRRGLSLRRRHFRFRPIEHLEELRHAMSHPGVQVRLGTLDVIVEVVAEELDAVDGGEGLGGVGEVPGGEDWGLACRSLPSGCIVPLNSYAAMGGILIQ